MQPRRPPNIHTVLSFSLFSKAPSSPPSLTYSPYYTTPPLREGGQKRGFGGRGGSILAKALEKYKDEESKHNVYEIQEQGKDRKGMVAGRDHEGTGEGGDDPVISTHGQGQDLHADTVTHTTVDSTPAALPPPLFPHSPKEGIEGHGEKGAQGSTKGSIHVSAHSTRNMSPTPLKTGEFSKISRNAHLIRTIEKMQVYFGNVFPVDEIGTSMLSACLLCCGCR